jgi:hypothetical protein
VSEAEDLRDIPTPDADGVLLLDFGHGDTLSRLRSRLLIEKRSKFWFEKLHRFGGYAKFCIEFVACCHACPDHVSAIIARRTPCGHPETIA